MHSSEPFGNAPRSARHARLEWAALTRLPAGEGRFDRDSTDDLPVAVRAWLHRSIAEGTPLASTGWLRMRGQIRLGTWRSFVATQVLTPGVGFVWAATANVAGLPVLGYDKYFDGIGEMRWRLGGLIPVMSARNPDITSSAAGRLAIESVFVPTAFRRAEWAGNGSGASATWSIGDRRETVDLDIDNDGRLRGALMERWGNPDGAEFGRYPFGVTVESEATYGGITIPKQVRAGWWWHSDKQAAGEFFRATITEAAFR